MAEETTLTITGNLTGDPELRFTNSGTAVANFTIASTPRSFDKNANEWKDGETIFMRCSLWREQAENLAESLRKGDRVMARGHLVSRSWEDKETGQKRSQLEMQVQEVSASMRYATVGATKAHRNSHQNGGGQQGAQQGAADNGGWGSPAPAAGNGGGWGSPAPAAPVENDPWATN